MKILVTGANGGYGSYAIEQIQKLATDDVELFGLVRDEEKAQAIEAKGVHARIGDFGDVESLKSAFKDIDRLLFVSVSIPGLQKNVVEAIKDSNIQYVAYTSIHGIDYDKFGLQINHKETELSLSKLSIPVTFLRNNFYLEIAAPQLQLAKETNQFQYFSKDGKVAWVLKQDLAEAGARVILGDAKSQILELSGEPVSYRQLAEVAEKAFGISINIQEADKATLEKNLASSNISDMGANATLAFQEYALNENNGEGESSSKPLEKVLGHPLIPLDQAIKEITK